MDGFGELARARGSSGACGGCASYLAGRLPSRRVPGAWRGRGLLPSAVLISLSRGTKGVSAKTINDYKSLAESNLIPFIGAYKLKALTAENIDDWLEDRRDHLTTRTMQAIHSILRRAIRRAQARDKVVRNVAALVDTPRSQERRPPKQGHDARPGHHRLGTRQGRPTPRLLALVDRRAAAGTEPEPNTSLPEIRLLRPSSVACRRRLGGTGHPGRERVYSIPERSEPPREYVPRLVFQRARDG